MTATGAATYFSGLGALFPAKASAGPPPPTGFGFIATHRSPVAGRVFTGLVVVDRDPALVAIRRVRCDAQLGGRRLRGRQRKYFAPPYRNTADVACSWRIPAKAGGRKLQLWHYRDGRRVCVLDTSGSLTDSHPFTWQARRSSS